MQFKCQHPNRLCRNTRRGNSFNTITRKTKSAHSCCRKLRPRIQIGGGGGRGQNQSRTFTRLGYIVFLFVYPLIYGVFHCLARTCLNIPLWPKRINHNPRFQSTCYNIDVLKRFERFFFLIGEMRREEPASDTSGTLNVKKELTVFLSLSLPLLHG